MDEVSMKFKCSKAILAFLFTATFNVQANVCCPAGASGAGNCTGCSSGTNSCVSSGSVCCNGGGKCATNRLRGSASYCWNGSSAACTS